MKRWVVRVVVAVVVLASGSVVPGAQAARRVPAPMDGLLRSALSRAASTDTILAIANFDRPATPRQARALARAGTKVVAYAHLPMAAVIGNAAALRKVATVDGVRSLYWNEAQQFDLAEAQGAIEAAAAWNLGYHGEGVGVAIIDSGVDATHPDLVDHVVANVKILGPEYVQQKHGDFDDLVVDVDNSDTTSGHGTHVAGDAAGDGTASAGKFRGPAYEADIVAVGTGEGLNIFTALAGFEYVVAHQAEHNIRVVNNSWGTSFRLQDPSHPVVRAAKAASDAGITVVFSAGNRYDEMTLSPYAAPWTVTVAAGAKAGGLTSFSSKGVDYDNLPTIPANAPGQNDFVADGPSGVGVYHPDVTGIGENIHSTRAPATVMSALGAGSGDDTLAPGEVPYYTTASGTSMSAPQVAGLVALVQQAFHGADSQGRWLTPAQVKTALQVSSRAMDGLRFFQQGYGLVNAPDAVALAASLANLDQAGIDAALATALAPLDAGVLAQRDATPLRSYVWRRPTMDSVGDVAKHVLPLSVGPATDRVRAIVSFPATTQFNVASVDLYLFDAAGVEVGQATTENASSNVQILDVDLADLAAPPAFGAWTLEARGDVSSNCFVGIVPRCTQPSETWVMAQLLDSGGSGAPVFHPTGATTLFMHNESAGSTAPPALVKPGYTWDGALVGGDLSSAAPDHPRAGFSGYAHTYAPGTGRPAVFRSAPLPSAVTVGGELKLDLYLQSEAGLVGRGSIGYWLYEVDALGNRNVVYSEELVTAYESGPEPVANHPVFALPLPHTFAAGSRFELELKFSAGVHAGLRFYYDAPAEPAALTLTTGTIS